ncbi:MAG: sigma-54-dependent Fis family transcriptional regulator [Planctomycetes bacterium]|nr:sigma-54-dependent Fis family transcriptional regulator [Planctomycetota bacterium]
MVAERILVVDDSRFLRRSLGDRLGHEGYEVLDAEDLAGARRFLEEGHVDLVLLDMRLPDGEGMALLRGIGGRTAEVPVIMMTAHGSVGDAVNALKLGAQDYLVKPLDLESLRSVVAKALETTRLRRQVRRLRAEQSRHYGIDGLLGTTPGMRAVLDLIERVAMRPTTTVLVQGESGTGKDLVAKAIHLRGPRADGPLVTLTCTAIPDTLLEGEIFGHEKGAFTGAMEQKPGLFEMADGGTVFLDEVGDMPVALQARLLRVLEDRRFRRVGGGPELRVDVRIVAATHRDLAAEVEAGRFREDLYYRLNVVPIRLPALRERANDIPLLASYFIDRFNGDMRRSVRGLSPGALAAARAYPWPGNVRELRNRIERGMILGRGEWVEETELFSGEGMPGDKDAGRYVLPRAGIDLAAHERDLLAQALTCSRGNQTRAAALLGIRRNQIRYRMGKFGLHPSDFGGG